MLLFCVRFASVDLLLHVILLNVASVTSSLTVPRSSVVVIGARVVMNCSGNGSSGNGSTFQWTYTAWNTSIAVNIYLGREIDSSFSNRYKIDKRINGQHNLIIDSVDLNHTGRYRCSSAIGKTNWTDVQLIVLGSLPVCAAITTEIEERKQTNLTVWCSISYRESGIPVFSWTKSNEEKNIVAITTTSGTNDVTLVNTSSIVKQQLKASDDGAMLQCRITFQATNNSEYAYMYTWNYTLSYPVGDSFTTQGAGATFVSSSNKYDATQDGSSNPDVHLTAFGIAGSILFLLTIIIAISCVAHRRRLKGKSSCRPDVAINTGTTSFGLNGDTIAENAVYTEVFKRKGPGGRIITGNAVYSEVMKPKGPSKASKEFRPIIADNPRQPRTETQNNKNPIGADGTVYADLSGVTFQAVSKGGVPKPPTLSPVDIYASIDHNGRAPPVPPTL